MRRKGGRGMRLSRDEGNIGKAGGAHAGGACAHGGGRAVNWRLWWA